MIKIIFLCAKFAWLKTVGLSEGWMWKGRCSEFEFLLLSALYRMIKEMEICKLFECRLFIWSAVLDLNTVIDIIEYAYEMWKIWRLKRAAGFSKKFVFDLKFNWMQANPIYHMYASKNSVLRKKPRNKQIF